MAVYDVAGKVAVVSGGGSGIGAACAVTLSRSGAKVMVADLQLDAAEAVVATIDKDGGVTLEDCELVSQQISALLDVEDAVPTEYELQVSSPGLDRKFYRDSDYQKFLGRLVRVKTSKPIRGLHVIVGRLKEYDGRNIVVSDPAVKKDPEYRIPLADIKETRLEVEI